MDKVWIVLPALLCGLASTSAGAQRATVAPHREPRATAPAATAWSPSQCGREPAAPAVDTSTVDRYNASVDRVTIYEKLARSYNACVSKSASAQQTAISNDARTRIDAIQAVSGGVQKRIATNFTALTTALRAGAPRLQAPAAH